MSITLRQWAKQINIDPVDLTGDEEMAIQLLDEDITGLIFYEDLKNQY